MRILDKDVINDFWLTKFQYLGNVTQVKDINITREIQKDPLCGGWMEISQRMDTSQRAQRSNPAESTRKITLKNWGRRKVTNQVHKTIVSRSSKDEQHAPEAVKEIEKNVRENKKKNPVTGWRKKRRSSSFLFHFLLGQTSSFTEGQVPIVSNSTATRLEGKSRFSLFFKIIFYQQDLRNVLRVFLMKIFRKGRFSDKKTRKTKLCKLLKNLHRTRLTNRQAVRTWNEFHQ